MCECDEVLLPLDLLVSLCVVCESMGALCLQICVCACVMIYVSA